MATVQQCYYCDTDLVEDWNMFPIGANEDNTQRLYDLDKVICDDCYDEHCTQWDIQPLEGD